MTIGVFLPIGVTVTGQKVTSQPASQLATQQARKQASTSQLVSQSQQANQSVGQPASQLASQQARKQASTSQHASQQASQQTSQQQVTQHASQQASQQTSQQQACQYASRTHSQITNLRNLARPTYNLPAWRVRFLIGLLLLKQRPLDEYAQTVMVYTVNGWSLFKITDVDFVPFTTFFFSPACSYETL